MYSVKVDDKELTNFINKAKGEALNKLNNAVKETTVSLWGKIRQEQPKRSGQLRNSYLYKVNGLNGNISSNLSYASIQETGGVRPAIVPKRRKWLTIPIDDKALTSTKARINKSSLDKLFKQVGFAKNGKLYSKLKGKSVREVFDDVGIVLAKKAKSGYIKGNFVLKRAEIDGTNMLYNKVSKIMSEVIN